MGRRRRAFPSLVCGAGVATLLTATPAGAVDGDQRITVTPHDGLRDGQVVQVDGSGWPDPRFDFQSWGLVQCTSATIASSTCGNSRAIPESEISSSGSFSVDYAVRRSFRSVDDTATITCDGPGGCHVVAFVLVDTPSRPGHYQADVPISFAASK